VRFLDKLMFVFNHAKTPATATIDPGSFKAVDLQTGETLALPLKREFKPEEVLVVQLTPVL
jgi:hypothetical protein